MGTTATPPRRRRLPGGGRGEGKKSAGASLVYLPGSSFGARLTELNLGFLETDSSREKVGW